MLARDGGCGMRDVTHVLLDILMVGKIHVSYPPGQLYTMLVCFSTKIR